MALAGCYSEADYQRRVLEEMMRQQAYGQLHQYAAMQPPMKGGQDERDNPVLLLLP